MICKYCNNTIPDESVFCMICGERVARKKREKKKEIKVPEPRQLKSGAWNIELRKEGESITEKTREECIARARAVRAGFLKIEKAPPKLPLKDVIRTYIDDNASILSPSTIMGYEGIIRNRFKNYMGENVYDLDWQVMVNDEAVKIGAKTLANAWWLVAGALKYSDIPVPHINLPQIVRKDRPWLDYEQIQKFLKAIEGKSCERACLLALHSLRDSEIKALTQESVKDGVIHVRGAVVPDKNGNMVRKEANKSKSSTRDIPVMIPRLEEIWPAEGEELKLQCSQSLRDMLERTCKAANLPVITIHSLRHSYASLAYHLGWDVMTTCHIGGWSDPSCVQRIYTHLSILDKNLNVDKMKAFYNPQITNEITNEN